MIDSWSFGGGTALMLQINHRESFDVDIFVDDPQLLPYLNPQTQGYALDVRPDAYQSDGSRALKIVFSDVGEIDFICAPSLSGDPIVNAQVRGRDVLLETPAEIIAKKIFYRGASMQPRDMFDIACVMKAVGFEYVIAALLPFKDECEKALNVAYRMNPQFAETIMTRLLYRESFSEIPPKAQAMTIELLETICGSTTGAKPSV
ncbi:nucleotidyl transferase AbiEii/AbiGii toxin family protein [Rhizobium sp. ZK1]|uniref:nucleotidyl transferase AbiEii/AbiGii toxin family protein n=1 Tax=Rhizobium sp. ZK1 TaxID=3389872 RepID=UPI0039F713E1